MSYLWDCGWRLKKSALRAHLTLEVERGRDRVRTDAVRRRTDPRTPARADPSTELEGPAGARVERKLAWDMDGSGLLAGEGGDVVTVIVW